MAAIRRARHPRCPARGITLASGSGSGTPLRVRPRRGARRPFIRLKTDRLAASWAQATSAPLAFLRRIGCRRTDRRQAFVVIHAWSGGYMGQVKGGRAIVGWNWRTGSRGFTWWSAADPATSIGVASSPRRSSARAYRQRASPGSSRCSNWPTCSSRGDGGFGEHRCDASVGARRRPDGPSKAPSRCPWGPVGPRVRSVTTLPRCGYLDLGFECAGAARLHGRGQRGRGRRSGKR